jgi:hypothetical protein
VEATAAAVGAMTGMKVVVVVVEVVMPRLVVGR